MKTKKTGSNQGLLTKIEYLCSEVQFRVLAFCTANFGILLSFVRICAFYPQGPPPWGCVLRLVVNVRINLSRNVDLLISASQRTGGSDVPLFSLGCSRLGSDVSAAATISLTTAIDCLKPPTSEGCPEK